MGKYDVWRELFAQEDRAEFRVAFEELERQLGSKLPKSARRYVAWWHGYPQNVWEQYGFKASPSFGTGQVVFRRAGVARPRSPRPPEGRIEGRTEPPLAAPSGNAWYWEGEVQATIVTYLATSGWRILAVTDTASRAAGTDIVATRDGRTLHVEVKGYPSAVYATGERKGQLKPTHPATQARQWFAGALLKAAMIRGDTSDDLVAIGLPRFETYENLVARCALVLERSEIEVIWVDSDGRIWSGIESSDSR